MFWSKKDTADGEHEDTAGWHPDGTNIFYEMSPYSKDINEQNPAKTRQWYQLRFDYTFRNENDSVYCAYTIPYTYTGIITHLKHLRMLQKSTRKSLLN